MDEWLNIRDRLEVRLRSKYNEEAINDLLKLIDKFISQNEKLWNYWRDVSNEVNKLIKDLINGSAEVIIRGEDVSGISVHGEYVTLETHRTNTGIVVRLVLKGLRGMTIRTLNVFKKTMSKEEYVKFINKVLKALKGGLEETDGIVNKGKAAIGTSQLWQVVIWSLLHPGKAHTYISGININEENVTIMWYLKSYEHNALKGLFLNDVERLDIEELLAFMLTAILGDGTVDIRKTVKDDRVYNGGAIIEITLASHKFDRWKPLLCKLQSVGFKSSKPKIQNNTVKVGFYDSNAIDLTRAIINVLPPILRDILDALSFDKWDNLRRIAKMELKWRKGESQVIVANYKFTVAVRESTVELVRKTGDGVEARKVIDELRAVYGDEFHARVNNNGKRLAVKISMYVFERYDEIKRQVIEVLRRKLEKTKDEKKKQIIIKHLTRLTTLTEGAATD